ncbi:hypothetical protein IGI04_002291 [Brassica rapa subsp. trilocularis]|uniref:DUF7870 domain-containing protein n=1 Tax=Brassica rapa subsp. trilocularis TaxID=1813537 RepID=A0ABQ7NV42_BRACM|nr:hypothetical protein IGI04_002291 [Brassica rapa subsp. trilocularis]
MKLCSVHSSSVPTKSAPLAGLLAHSAEAAESQLISARRTVRALGRWSGSGRPGAWVGLVTDPKPNQKGRRDASGRKGTTLGRWFPFASKSCLVKYSEKNVERKKERKREFRPRERPIVVVLCSGDSDRLRTNSGQEWEIKTRRRAWRTLTWFRRYAMGRGSIRPNGRSMRPHRGSARFLSPIRLSLSVSIRFSSLLSGLRLTRPIGSRPKVGSGKGVRWAIEPDSIGRSHLDFYPVRRIGLWGRFGSVSVFCLSILDYLSDSKSRGGWLNDLGYGRMVLVKPRSREGSVSERLCNVWLDDARDELVIVYETVERPGFGSYSFHESFAVDTVINSPNEDYWKERAIEMSLRDERLGTHKFTNTFPTSFDAVYSTSVVTHPRPAKQRLISIDTHTGTSIDIRAAAKIQEQENIPSPTRFIDTYINRFAPPKPPTHIRANTQAKKMNILPSTSTEKSMKSNHLKNTSSAEITLPSIDATQSTSIDTTLNPNLSISKLNDYANIDYGFLTPDQFGIFRDPDGNARAMDGRILQVSREDIADILQVANGPDNLFSQQRGTPDVIQTDPNNHVGVATTEINPDLSRQPKRQASIDGTTETSIDRVTPTSIDRDDPTSIDRRYEFGNRAFDMYGARKFTWEQRDEYGKKALSKLEDVLLEPPRAASRKSRTYLKRTRYLPDLMGDTMDLGSYSRRVFIDVGNGKGSSGTEWFVKNYPTRNLKFEMYKIKTVNDEMSLESENMGMTEWLKENVKEEEYVVMKAEAEVVEEMMRSKSIKMVDELFLECKPKGLGLRGRKMQSKSGKAYWECLALYGKLRDEGVAVHQWWG